MLSDGEPLPVEFDGKRDIDIDDKTTFSLEVDSRYRLAFQPVNSSRAGVDTGASAKELAVDAAGVGEQTEELPRRMISKAAGRRGSKGRRRVAYPGAPRSMTGGGDGWMYDDDQLPSYVMTLSRYPRLYTTRGGRLVPAVWPRRTYGNIARQRPHDTNHTSTTVTSSTPGPGKTFNNQSSTSPLPPTTTTTTSSSTATTTTAATTTTMMTTTTKLPTTTTGENERRELAAAVHDMRQPTTSPDDQKLFSLNVGAPEIGECPRSLLVQLIRLWFGVIRSCGVTYFIQKF